MESHTVNSGKQQSTPRYTELPRETLAQAQASSPEAFAELVRCYERRVYACIARIVAYTLPRNEVDDLTQDVFLKIHRKLNRFDPERPGSLSGWILKIASRTALDALRKQSSQNAHSQRLASEADVIPLHPSWRSRPDESLERRETRERILRGIASLSPSMRAALVLKHFHHFELEEIATVIGLPDVVLSERPLLSRIAAVFRADSEALKSAEELDLDELATLLDISKAGVIKRLQRARRQLETEIRELDA